MLVDPSSCGASRHSRGVLVTECEGVGVDPVVTRMNGSGRPVSGVPVTAT